MARWHACEPGPNRCEFSHQENFRRNAFGLLRLVEAGKSAAVRAVEAFQKSVGAENLKLSYFRGFETVQQPDLLEIVPGCKHDASRVDYPAATCLCPILSQMQSWTVTVRSLAAKIPELQLNPLMSYYLLHPDLRDDLLHPSRSVTLPDTCHISFTSLPSSSPLCPPFICVPGNLGQSVNLLHSLKSPEHLKFRWMRIATYFVFRSV